MKKPFLTLLLLLISLISFAQGIAVQGIARDNESSAITVTSLTFTFSITQDDNTVLYAETQSIKTDNYGVFSHIVSTGNPLTGTFNNVDFSIQNLKMKVSVAYNSDTIEVYNQPFQYTPYAYFAKKAALATNATNADDGVPTGGIMPYIGITAPAGWVLCDGQSLPDNAEHSALRSLVGPNTPNLKGMFLRGAGVSPVNGQSGPGLMATQGDEIKGHNHESGTLYTLTSGWHGHGTKISIVQRANGSGSGTSFTNQDTGDSRYAWSDGAGDHTHLLDGRTANTGGSETRPVSYGVNYIIKL